LALLIEDHHAEVPACLPGKPWELVLVPGLGIETAAAPGVCTSRFVEKAM
jgi:hypothetical protein